MRGYILAAIMIVAAGAATIWAATDGLRAFTAEGARRLQALERPARVPQPMLTDMTGGSLPLAAEPGKVLLVEFIFATCPTICREAGDAFSRLSARLDASRLGARARMVSVRFDPKDRIGDTLSDYGQSHNADGKRWTIARFTDFAQRDATLAAYGVTVIPDPLFGYQHNAAIHMVNDQGRLVGIFNLEDEAGVLEAIGRNS